MMRYFPAGVQELPAALDLAQIEMDRGQVASMAGRRAPAPNVRRFAEWITCAAKRHPGGRGGADSKLFNSISHRLMADDPKVIGGPGEDDVEQHPAFPVIPVVLRSGVDDHYR